MSARVSGDGEVMPARSTRLNDLMHAGCKSLDHYAKYLHKFCLWLRTKDRGSIVTTGQNGSCHDPPLVQRWKV